MLELRLLGLHAVRGADGSEAESLPAQPKRFALLAYLAIAGGDGYHRRDSLAAMFWPDLDQFAARRALRNTLYHLRESLGEGVIVARGDEAVSIDPTALTCDVTRLAAAVASGHYETAVDLYRGELLAGLHVPGAGTVFEDWLSGERRRVTGLVMQALAALADRDEATDDWPAAARWAERACAIAPDDERWLRRGMTLLERASDTGGALRLYETYVHRLAAELEASPSVETEALAARIRSGRVDQLAVSAGAPSPPTIVDDNSASSESIAAPQSRIANAPRAAPPTPGSVPMPWRSRVRRSVFWTAAVATTVVFGAVGWRIAGATRSHPGRSRARVLIAVFDNRTGDAHLQSLGRMTQDWLAQGIVRTHLVDVVDPRAVFVQTRAAPVAEADPIAIARRTGANLVVSGSYDRSADTLVAQAAVIDAASGRIVRAVGPVVGPAASPTAVIDALRSRVMTALASAIDVRATQDIGRADEIPSYDAYEAYVEGWDAFWHGNGKGAEALFLRGAHLDSTFTESAIAAAEAASNSLDCALVDSLTRVTERARSLDHVDRLTLRIAAAHCSGHNDETLRLALERADLEPDNAGDQMSAAAAALWANRPARTLELLARVNPATDLAWNTDTTHFAWYGGTAEALHMLGRHRDELAVANRLPDGAPLGRAWLRGSALAALSRPTAVLALLDSAMALPVETSSDPGLAPFTDGRPAYTFTPAWVANWIARELAVHGDTVTARQAAARAVAWYRGRPAVERSTPEERLVASWSLEMTGDFPEAERIARQLVAEDSANVDFRGELAGLAAERGDTALADSLDRWLAAQPVDRVSWTASMYRARVAALLGRHDDAIARVRETLDNGAWPRWLHQEPALDVLRARQDFVTLTAPRG
jgi:DNA-binding SARP family transcriptional activator/TolB-like protein